MLSLKKMLPKIFRKNKANTIFAPKISTNISVWSMQLPQVFDSLSTTYDGLDDLKIQERTNSFGKNQIKSNNGVSKFSIFVSQFKSPLIFMLIGSAILAGFLNEWLNTFVIMLAVVVNTILGFYQEYHAEQTLQKLKLYIKERIRVRRNSVDQEIDALDLVPGDIIYLTYGSRIPVDARIISLNNLAVDESILTGESIAVRKNLEIVSEGAQITERNNMVFAGTLVSEGYGTAVVYRTGSFTELGKIAMLVSNSKRDKTPLQKALAKFGWLVFFIVILLVSVVFILGIMRGLPVLDMLILSTAIAVGAIPEALPISLTVILAVGAERLASKKGVMRSLSSVETLGSTNLIMTDKTGTLTEAKMRLVDILTITDLKNNRQVLEYENGLPKEDQKYLLSLALSNIDVVKDLNSPSTNFIGRPLEVNIAIAADKNGLSFDKNNRTILLPFNSSYKFSVGQDFTNDKIIALGAPDVLLQRSKMSKDEYILIENEINKISAQGNRILGIAEVSKDKINYLTKERSINEKDIFDVNFLGLIVLHDPIRKEVPEAIARIQNSGAEVVIVTGDIKGTAISIAKELGWSINENNVISGAELHLMTDEELLENLPNIKVFARVTPEDKLRVGLLYKKLGKIVAMTGDGVNDAPSLKMADIGIALGSGSDVAKSAADLVLLDDNFKTIVLAIEEGRRILSNIRKAFTYLMSSALDGVILLGGCLVFALPLPLTALHIIWINFFTGSLPALSFAFDEDFDTHSLKTKGQRKIFNKEVKILTAGIGLLSSILLFVFYFFLLKTDLSFGEVKSIIFACFALYVVFAVYSFRSLHKPIYSYPIFSNKFLNRSVLFSVIICSATLFVPFLRNIFELAPMPKMAIWLLPVWFIVNIFLIEITKFGFRIFLKKK